MKRKVIRAPPVHKILEEQSSKLKEKLELLKQQIQQKKKEKEGGKQTNQTESTTSKSKVSATSNLDNTELVELLTSLHMESIINKLRDKQVYTLEDFKSLQPEVIDQWKDIAVGYRIKLKKHLNGGNIGLSPSPQRKISLEKPKNIEEIVKCRQKDRVYVPLTNQSEEQYIDEELSEHQQERMIQNLMSAFNTTDQIQEIQLKPSTKPTVVIQAKEAWGIGKSIFPEYQYCWSCLKMLQQPPQQYKNRSFCSENCIDKYKQVLKVEEDNQFFQKIRKTQSQFSKYLQNRNNPGSNKRANRAIEPKQEYEIDFDIL